MSLCATAKDPVVTYVSIVGEGTGNGGSAIVTATCSAKKAGDVTELDLIKCAIHGVLFNGWTDNASNYTATTHRAICGDPDVETQHADYFADFFASPTVTSYATIVPETRSAVKSGKVFNVSQQVSVNQRQLRKKLEKDGIIRKLGL